MSDNNTVVVSRRNTISKVKKFFGGTNNNNNNNCNASNNGDNNNNILNQAKKNNIKIKTKLNDPSNNDVYSFDKNYRSSPQLDNSNVPFLLRSNKNNQSTVLLTPTSSISDSSKSLNSSAGACRSNLIHDKPLQSQPQLRKKHTSTAGTQNNFTINSANSSSKLNVSLNSTNCSRFVVLDSDTHEHHLKHTKRQEKISSMIRNFIGAQKLRNEARCAVPDIITDPYDTKNTNNYPKSLMSNYVNQIDTNKLNSNNSNNFRDINDKNSMSTISSNISSSGGHSNLINSNDINNMNTSPNEQGDTKTFLEKYGKCQEVLGKGAFGVVRICHKKNNGTNKQDGESLFAVKEFKKRANENTDKYKKRLTSEFCISSSLHHPNVVSTLDLFQDAKGEYCEVMEYCAGGDLFTLILASGKLEYIEADCFFKQLIRGVNYIHELGVAHRDLKPENILLTSNGVVKITDFGNSECFKMAWEKNIYLSSGICGSTPYIAPEEYCQKEFDPRPVDIWACGLIYLTMRTGYQVWSVATKDDPCYRKYLKNRKGKEGYKPIEQLKRARCRNVIYSMLDPVPSRRITGKQIINSEWGREIKCCHDKVRRVENDLKI